MVSSGISNNIMAIRSTTPVVAGNGAKDSASFESIMMQSFGNNQNENSFIPQGKMDSAKDTAASDVTRDMAVKNQKVDRHLEKKVESMTESKPQKADSKLAKKLEEVAKDIEEIIQDVRKMLKEAFGVTDEEIEEALKTLGLDFSDAMTEPGITDFVVELSGMESSVDLLFAPDIMSQMNQLAGEWSEQINALAKELELEPELLNVIVDTVAQAMDEKVELSKIDWNSILDGNTLSDSLKAMPTVEQNPDENTDVNPANELEPQLQSFTQTIETSTTKDDSSELDFSSSKESAQSGKHTAGINEFVEGFADNLTNAVKDAFEMHGMTEEVTPAQIVHQIMDQIKVTVTQNLTSMEMMLNPENLGKVNMNISVKESMVTATFVAQNEEVKAAIENQIVQLKETLNNQGLKVEAVEVTVESHAFEANTNQNNEEAFAGQRDAKKKSQRALRIDSLDELGEEELSEEERIVVDMMKNEGNQVNFKA